MAALTLASGVGVLAGCSSGLAAPQDISGAAARPAVSTKTDRVGDDPNGCYQFGQGTSLSQGWTCSYTGSPATITVPGNATGIQVALAGGEGGNSNPASGGYGTAVRGTWSVTGGQTLTVNVGQGASDDTPGSGAASGTSTVDGGKGSGGSGPGSGDGHSGGNGPALANGTSGAAGGSYVSSDGQATSMAQANAGGDGSISITWILS